jgi:hypothetical protein
MTTDTTALTAAAKASTASWRAEIEAAKAGRKFDHFAAINEVIEILDPKFAAEMRALNAAEEKAAAAEATRLAAAKAADPTLADRVAARRAARNAERKF